VLFSLQRTSIGARSRKIVIVVLPRLTLREEDERQVRVSLGYLVE